MRRVIKLGGSLLDRPSLIDDVEGWLDRNPCRQTMIVCGGGAMVDAVRDLDRIRPLSSVQVHWLCVDLLHQSFQICAEWFPHWHPVASESCLQDWLSQDTANNRVALISPRAFYQRCDGDPLRLPETRLPETWQTTTDSIAALLAKQLDADELVIWKSCEVDRSETIESMVARGVLDEAFIDATTNQPIFASDRTRVIRI